MDSCPKNMPKHKTNEIQAFWWHWWHNTPDTVTVCEGLETGLRLNSSLACQLLQNSDSKFQVIYQHLIAIFRTSNTFQTWCNEYWMMALCFSYLNLGKDNYNLKLQEANIGVFMPQIGLYFCYSAKLTSPVTAITVPVLMSSTLAQLVHYTLSKF